MMFIIIIIIIIMIIIIIIIIDKVWHNLAQSIFSDAK